MKTTNQYLPQTVSHPGETLMEKLDEVGMGPKEFAIRTQKPEKTISAIIACDSSITPDMAVVFEDVLGIPARFWLARQQNYNEAVARLKKQENITKDLAWAAMFPYKEMEKLGWIVPTKIKEERVENLYKYFRVGNQDAFEDYYFNQKLKLSFRLTKSLAKKPYSIAAWLRQGEIQSSQLEGTSYDEKSFTASLTNLKNLMATHPDGFFKQLQQICLSSGVKVVYTPCLPGASIHGSTRWFGDNPLIQMSAKYPHNDSFWFTFFHEVGHILLHGKKYIAIEKIDYKDEDKVKEKEADAFAVKWTFSDEEEKEVLTTPNLTPELINRYAKKFNTHPGVIIGRFHHKGMLHYSIGREYIIKIDLSQGLSQ